tara:strand:- start:65 stop:424 length:360 start_codon:yes stop_codon:yes gene_type:complete
MEEQALELKNNKIDPEYDKVYAFTEEEHKQHVRDIITEYEFDRKRTTDLHNFGEWFLETEEERYVKVRPGKKGDDGKYDDGVKTIFTDINIAEILLRMSETLNKINDSLMIISYRIEGE